MGNILLVDDEINQLELLKDILEFENHNVLNVLLLLVHIVKCVMILI